MGSSIDRRGTQAVLDGYEIYRKQSQSAYYSVWQGRTLKFAHMNDNDDEGVDLLDQSLDLLKNAGTNAVYTLRMHKTVDKDGMISDKTPYYGSFNFVVNEADTSSGVPDRNSGVMYELKALREEMKALREEQEAGVGHVPQDPTQEMVMNILNHPVVSQLAGVAIDLLTGRRNNSNMGTSQSNPQQSGRHGLAGVEMTTEAKEASIIKSIQRIAVVDPDIHKTLEKLAALAETDPDKYRLAKSML